MKEGLIKTNEQLRPLIPNADVEYEYGTIAQFDNQAVRVLSERN